MAWYDPFGWFLKPEDLKEIVLHCDNPSCRAPIQTSTMVYDSKRQEVYHDGGCHTDAELLSGFTENRQTIGQVTNHRYIDVDKAKNLFARGKLKQVSNLEGKTASSR